MGWIGCVCCENFQHTFVARTIALIVPIWHVLHRVSYGNEMVQNTQKCTKRTITWAYGPIRWIGCVCRGKFWHAFVARTFALITPVWPILHRVSCCNKMERNTSKMYEAHHNISLGYNGVDRVRSLWKIPTRFHSTNFCINCTSSAHFEPSFTRKQNGPKCTQRVRNAPK